MKNVVHLVNTWNFGNVILRISFAKKTKSVHANVTKLHLTISFATNISLRRMEVEPMKLGNAIREICRREQITRTELSRRAGFNHVQSLNMIMRRGSTSLDILLRIANAAGYDVILFPRDFSNDPFNIGDDPITLEPTRKAEEPNE